MGIQHCPEGGLFVDLPGGPQLEEALRGVVEAVQTQNACDVVMDFSQVTLLNSSCIAALLRLRKELVEQGHRLVLCQVGHATQGILSITGLTAVFEIAGDRAEALAPAQAVLP
jgi:anti-anti-sigma factor